MFNQTNGGVKDKKRWSLQNIKLGYGSKIEPLRIDEIIILGKIVYKNTSIFDTIEADYGKSYACVLGFMFRMASCDERNLVATYVTVLIKITKLKISRPLIDLRLNFKLPL